MLCPTCEIEMGMIQNRSLETIAELCILCRRSATSCGEAEQLTIAKLICKGCQESPFSEEKEGLHWHQCTAGHIM